MIQRALLVLLIVINLGVAAWWATRAPPAPTPAVEQPAGVPRLQLLSEAPRRTAPRPAATATATAAPLVAAPATVASSATAPVAMQCFSFGPYPNPAALRRAHARVQAQVVRAQVREVAAAATGWRVFLPPLPSRAEAQAMVERMRAAGLDDLLVIVDGSEANAIALGRYRGEDAARRRQAALQKAGFTVQIAPLGAVATQGWIDVATGSDFDSARVAQDIAAAQARKIDCATVK